MIPTNMLYRSLLAKISERGTRGVNPRGMGTREILANQYVVPMSVPVITLRARKLGYKFLAAEAAWILSGRNDVEGITKYSKAIWQFSDNGELYFGAYGPKILDQLSFIIRKLTEDRDTRQAVINIWRENPYDTKDMPCSTNVQFLVRDGKLNVIWTMRSSDAYLGIPYDQFNASCLGTAVCIMMRTISKVDIELGDVYFNMGSSHLYDKNDADVGSILADNSTVGNPDSARLILDPKHYETRAHFIRHLQQIADDNFEDHGPNFLRHIHRAKEEV